MYSSNSHKTSYTHFKICTKFCGSLINAYGALLSGFPLFWYDLKKETKMVEMDLQAVILRCAILMSYQTRGLSEAT